MTKHVVTTRMVPHLWAQQNPDQECARSRHNTISYHGKELISYHIVIARFVEDVNGETVGLISRNRWGTTTGGQISAARRAVNHLTVFDDLSDVGNQYSNPDHQHNLNVMIREYREDIARQKRVLNFWRGGPNSLAKTRDYARRFGLEMPVIDEAADWAEVVAVQAERERKRNTPQALAKREKDAERRAAKRTEAQRIAAEERADRAHIYALEKPERDRQTVIAFRAGDSHLGYNATDAEGGTLLRTDGVTLETSMGARVPLVQAVRVFRIAQAVRELGVRQTFPGLEVGDFKVNWFEKDGTIRAGCHIIHWPEIERLAVSLGLIEAWAVPGEPRSMAA